MSLIYLLNQLKENEIRLLLNEPLKNHTTFRVGGPAGVMLLPDTAEKLQMCISFCNENNMRYILMGNGSNILFSDEGTSKVIIKTKQISDISADGTTITAGCGVLLSKLAAVALENSLTGLEFAAGIPASLGGAVYMNAGAYGGEMSDVVYKTQYIDNDGALCEITGNEHGFSYRHSFFSGKNYCILQSQLLLKKGNAEEIKAKMELLSQKRREKQPLEYPSAGSTFKRPDGCFAAALIEECGLKGLTIGGAQVSEKHSGFIINIGNATSADILKLIKKVQDTVLKEKGIMLETEVVYVPN